MTDYLYRDKNVYLLFGDCLDRMQDIEDGSIDMVMADLPYGTTQCKWDVIIPFEPLWAHYKRVCKLNAAIVLTCSQPFTSLLVMSNLKAFRYEWIWEKHKPVGHLNAKIRPMVAHENIAVFSFAPNRYIPQGLQEIGDLVQRTNNGAYGDCSYETIREYTGYPRSVLKFAHDKSEGLPTQKPVALMEYLIKTYTNEGQTVLDNTMGSGTTGIACRNLNRVFVGIEKDANQYDMAAYRILDEWEESNANTKA